MKVNFKESQSFKQWFWLLFIPFGVVLGKKIFDNHEYDAKAIFDYELVLMLVFMVIFGCLFLIMNLKTVLDDKGIQMSFYPFVKKKLKWTDVKTFKLIDYGFVGGWGIHFWTKYGTVYNVKGNKGLAIELKNGKKMLIGTQKPKELSTFLDNLSVHVG